MELGDDGSLDIATIWSWQGKLAANANGHLVVAAPLLYTELAETHAALCLMGSTAKDTDGRPYIGSERWKRNKAAMAAARGETDGS